MKKVNQSQFIVLLVKQISYSLDKIFNSMKIYTLTNLNLKISIFKANFTHFLTLALLKQINLFLMQLFHYLKYLINFLQFQYFVV